jgi:hypothetical protein
VSPQDRIEALEDRVAALEEALGVTRQFPVEWGLTVTEARMLGILCKTGSAPAERFMVALYSDRSDPPASHVIAVLMCKLRAKMKPLGVEISSRNGSSYGYSIPAAQKARLLDA